MSPGGISCAGAGLPGNPPLLLLHGFFGRGGDWRAAAETLADRFYCLMPDLPGHGASAHRGDDCSVEATAAALLRLLDAAGIERTALLGYSLGGRIALYLTLEHPDRVERLVLESGSPGLRSEEERSARRRLDAGRAALLRDHGIEAFLDEWLQIPVFDSLRQRPELVERLRRSRRNDDPEGLALSLEYLGTGVYPSLWERLPELRRPVLLTFGTLDEKFAAINHEMARHLPRARLAPIADAGHNVHIERPGAWLAVVTEFLTGDPADKA